MEVSERDHVKASMKKLDTNQEERTKTAMQAEIGTKFTFHAVKACLHATHAERKHPEHALNRQDSRTLDKPKHEV